MKFSQVGQTRRGLLWHGNAVAAFPCPALKEFVITHPDSADRLFDHLPPTLLSLSLCCWHHLYHECLDPYRTIDPRDGWLFSFLLPSSALQQVLHRAYTPSLVRLTLEYRADNGDDELLHHIAHTYPQLTYLKLIGYRARAREEVPVERIARALTPLARLHELKLHLDLPEMPFPGYTLWPGGPGSYRIDHLERFRVIVYETADIFARELGSCVRLLSIFTPTLDRTRWACFKVVHGRAVRKVD